MTRDFEQGLRGALTGAAEGLPANPSRYEQTEARVRRGRRRAGIAVAAAAVVLVTAGIAAPQVLGRLTGGSVDDGLVTGTRDVDNLSCPEPAAVGSTKATGSGPLVPEGAVSARFCPGKPAIDEASAGDPDVMKTTITHGVDQLVTALNRLGPASGNAECTADLGPTYNLVLGYPGGRQAVIAYESYGCGTAKYGDEYRMGAGTLDDLGRRLLRAQPDAALKCPTDKAPMDVPAPTAAGTFVPAGASVARLCARENPAGGDTALTQVVFDPANAAKLAAELNALPTVDANAVCTMELGITYDLVLGYPDGRRIVTTFQAYGCGYAQHGKAFRMNANRIVDTAAGLAEQQRLETSPSSTPPIAASCPILGAPGDKANQPIYDSYTRDPDNSVPQPAAAGRVCRYDATETLRDERELSPERAESLRALVNQSARQRTSSCEWTTYTGPTDIILLTDRVGGRYELRVLSGCTTLLDINGIAQASPSLRRQLDRIFQ